MKLPVLLGALLLIVINSTAQITTADNGITSPDGTKVQLGGSLIQSTSINLGNGYDLIFHKNGTKYFSILNNGNIGFGTGSPGARLGFINCDESDDPIGITWYNPGPTSYGIHRTAGAWQAPDYQQLRLSWNTGIVLDPGVNYGKSYVDIKGNGLRVTQGNVGIGTSNPGNRLSILTGIANTSGLQFVNLGGTSPAAAGNGKVLTVDNNGNVILVYDAGGASGWGINGNSATNPSNDFIGTADEQALVFRTNNSPRMRILPNGNLLLNKTQDNGNVLQIAGNGSFVGPIGTGAALFLGDNGINKSFGIVTYGDASGNDRYTVIGHNMWEGSMYNANKQGGGVYLDDRSGVLPIRFMIRKAGTDPSIYAAGVSAAGHLLIGTMSDNGNALQVNGTMWASGLILPGGASAGKVLTSDANGNATWQTATGSAGWAYGGNAVSASSTFGTTSNYDLPIVTNNTERMRIGANGNVGIGTTKITGYKLSVDGIIRARKVRVDQDTWADYVFDNNYQLRSIKELEQFIQEQKHLPDVPSAAEVKKEGLDLGDNQAILLKKIEELTLYVIDQNKRIDEQQKMLQHQQKEIKALKKENGNKNK